MGFRFRKSFKIAPGVKVNLNKKSAGVTFGTKGAHYTVNTKGKRTTTVGIPGTGLSYTTTNSKKTDNKTEIPDENINITNTTEKKRWYKRTGPIILLLIFFFPAGLFLMWKYTNWNKKIKVAISAFFAFLFIISLFSSSDSPSTEDAFVNAGISESTTDENSSNLNIIPEIISKAEPTVQEAVSTEETSVAEKASDETETTICEETNNNLIISTTKISATTTKTSESTTKETVTTTKAPVTTTKAPVTTTKAAVTTTKAPVTTTKKTVTTTKAQATGRTVYITPHGERYHLDPDCGGKNSYSVSINNVGGRTPCKKCAQ